jgi:peroxiredoxin
VSATFGVVSTGLLFVTLLGIGAVLVASAATTTRARTRGPAHHTGLHAGEAAPPFAVPDIANRMVTVPDPERPTLLVFADATCTSCLELLPDLDRFAANPETRVTTIVISPGPPEKARKLAAETGSALSIVPDAGLIAASYRTSVSPSAVLVSTNGHVVRSVRKRPDVLSLLRTLGHTEPA